MSISFHLNRNVRPGLDGQSGCWTESLITSLVFRLNSYEARREAVRAMFHENPVNPVYRPLDAKLV